MGVSTRTWADHLLDGKLDELIRDLRSTTPPTSAEKIAFALMERGVDVSRETVRRWVNDLEAAA